MKHLKINFVLWNSLWFSVFICSRSALTYVQRKILFHLGKNQLDTENLKGVPSHLITGGELKRHQTPNKLWINIYVKTQDP